MQEIVTTEQVEALFVALAVAGPFVGAGIGWARGRRALIGLLWGLLFTANWILWCVYNAITNRLGLDTVRNLLVNLALFIAVGAIAGYVVALRTRRRDISYATGTSRRQTPDE